MKPHTTALVIIAAVVASGVLVAPPAIRGGLRCYALHRVLRLPEARARAAVRPSRRTLTALAGIHPVNLGYATFDTGSTNAISVGAATRGTGVLITNSDVHMTFSPPFGPEKSRNPISAEVSAGEARQYPHMLAFIRQMEADPVAARMVEEETLVLPFFRILFMSKDDFLVYSMRLAGKALTQFGSNGIQFFESPNAKGIVRIGKATNDNRFATVLLASPDGTKMVGLVLSIPRTSSNDISASLDPILRSFRFTTDSIGDPDRIKALMREAGIFRPEDSQQSYAANGTQSNLSETRNTLSTIRSHR